MHACTHPPPHHHPGPARARAHTHTQKDIQRCIFLRTHALQILTNYLTNALKFTPAGGSVCVRVWRTQSDTDRGEGVGVGRVESASEEVVQGPREGMGVGLSSGSSHQSRYLRSISEPGVGGGGGVGEQGRVSSRRARRTVSINLAEVARSHARDGSVPAEGVCVCARVCLSVCVCVCVLSLIHI